MPKQLLRRFAPRRPKLRRGILGLLRRWRSSQWQFVEDGGIGGEADGVKVGEFVVARVADYLAGFEGVVVGGCEDGFGEGLVKPDLPEVEGVLEGDVGPVQQKSRKGSIH